MNYFETIYDITTGETTTREYTAEEVATMQAAEAQAAEELAAYEAHKAARLAAEQKLAALGLTKEDLTALGL